MWQRWSSRSSSAVASTSSCRISPHCSKPLFEVNHGRGMLVAAVDELEEQDGAAAGDRQVADLVHDQERGVSEGLEALVQASGGLGLLGRVEGTRITARTHVSSIRTARSAFPAVDRCLTASSRHGGKSRFEWRESTPPGSPS